MDALTWSGSLGPFLNPVMLAAVVVFFAAFVINLVMGFAGMRPADPIVNPDHTISYRMGPVDFSLAAMKYAVFAVLACIAIFILGGILQPGMAAKGIIGGVSAQFLPVWIALVVTFVLSIRYKRRLGLYGKLFDNLIGMIGFGLVMFWIFTAIFAPMIATHGAIDVVSALRNDPPGSRCRGPRRTAVPLLPAGRRCAWPRRVQPHGVRCARGADHRAGGNSVSPSWSASRLACRRATWAGGSTR